MLTRKKLAKMIDNSLLNPTLSDKELDEGCKLAVGYEAAFIYRMNCK